MSKYINGLVSVIMPTYKRSEKLIRAIKSVLNQSYSNLELLLVNDNDPDDDYTKELKQRVSEFEMDSRFKLVIQDKHINGAVARNVGIKLAKGEYIAFLDDDDWWKTEKIQKQIDSISELPKEYGVVSCKIERYDNEKLIARLPIYHDGYVFKDILMLKSDFATGTILVRHEALDEIGYFDEKLLRHQDLQLLVNLTCKYKMHQLDEYLHCCDVSDGQNRPNLEKIIKYKRDFFVSVEPVISLLSNKEKKMVKLINNFEIGYVALKCKKIVRFIQMVVPCLFYFPTLKIVLNKIASKRKSKEIKGV